MLSFKTILNDNGFTTGCPAPLWKLRLTDNQFESLKQYLVYKYLDDGDFNACPREAALLFAEWWKRDSGGSKEQGITGWEKVFSSLGLNPDKDAANSLYENAKRIFEPSETQAYIPGAKLVKTQGGREFLYSLYYQGGFPMGRACTQTAEGARWKRIIEKFVKQNIDFEDLPGAIIAKRALREYKDYLVSAAREHKPEGMPFACDGNHPWYALAVDGVKKGDEERASHPFHIKWNLVRRVDDFLINGRITGPSELSKKFLFTYPDLEQRESIPVQLFKDDEYVETLAEYERTASGKYVSYYNIDAPIIYDGKSRISLRIPDYEKVLLSSDVNLAIPHSFFRAANGVDYEMGSKFGDRVSLIVFNDDWELAEAIGEHTNPIPSSFGGEKFWMVMCPATDDEETSFCIKKKHAQDQYTFGSDREPSWTEVDILKPYNPLIVEDLCDFTNPEQVRVLRCTDDEDQGMQANLGDVFFKSKESDEWLPAKDIPYGKVQCAVIKDGIYSSPEKNVISVGPGFKVELMPPYRPTECHFRISWDQGEVYSEDGNARPGENGDWVVRKEFYENLLPLNCIPKTGTPFRINVRTKYRDFNIYTPSGEKLKKYSIIPWSEINSYRYVSRDNGTLGVKCGQDLSTQLPFLPQEGSLGLILTPGRLKKYAGQAEQGLNVAIRYCEFTLQQYPLQLQYDEQGCFHLDFSTQPDCDLPFQKENRESFLENFKGHLLLVNSDGEFVKDIPRDEDGLYHMPEGGGRFLVVGNQRGYIKPIMWEDGVIAPLASTDERSEVLDQSSLEDKCWDSAEYFLNAGLRYGVSLTDLPWINCVIAKPDYLLALYCRLLIEADGDPGKIRDVENRMERVIKVYNINILTATGDCFFNCCKKGTFTQPYSRWMHTYGRTEDSDEDWNLFLCSIAGKVSQKCKQSITEG